jgi:UV DNA damage endonuclease
MSKNKPIQLGLCCLNTELRGQKVSIFASRTMTQKKLLEIGEEKGVKEIKKRVYLNLIDLIKMIHWNEKNGIKVFRLSSEIFPHKTNTKINDYGFDFCKKILKRIGLLAKKYNQRLTFHPGQYNVIGAKDDKIFQSTLRELKHHADIFDLMGLYNNSVMVIHGGGVYGEKKKQWIGGAKNISDYP